MLLNHVQNERILILMSEEKWKPDDSNPRGQEKKTYRIMYLNRKFPKITDVLSVYHL